MFRQKHTARLVATLTTGMTFCLGLTGCGEETSGTSSPTDRSIAPVVPVPDETVSESTRVAYENYLRIADQVLADGGLSPNRIKAVTTGEFAQTFEGEVVEYSSAGLRTVGSTETKSFELQSWFIQGTTFTATAYVCDDVSGIDVLNSEGMSIVSPDRDATTPYAVTFQGDALDELVVSAKELWAGTDFCDV
jgi:hypothetical protein